MISRIVYRIILQWLLFNTWFIRNDLPTVWFIETETFSSDNFESRFQSNNDDCIYSKVINWKIQLRKYFFFFKENSNDKLNAYATFQISLTSKIVSLT